MWCAHDASSKNVTVTLHREHGKGLWKPGWLSVILCSCQHLERLLVLILCYLKQLSVIMANLQVPRLADDVELHSWITLPVSWQNCAIYLFTDESWFCVDFTDRWPSLKLIYIKFASHINGTCIQKLRIYIDPYHILMSTFSLTRKETSWVKKTCTRTW